MLEHEVPIYRNIQKDVIPRNKMKMKPIDLYSENHKMLLEPEEKFKM